jgi:opacity protein-like surface antigen
MVSKSALTAADQSVAKVKVNDANGDAITQCGIGPCRHVERLQLAPVLAVEGLHRNGFAADRLPATEEELAEIGGIHGDDGGLPPAANMASGTGTNDAAKIKLGWTAGGGVDIQLGYNWILNLTYLHVGIDNVTATNGFAFADGTGRSSTGTSTTSASFKFDTYRVGLSHKFSL